MAVGKRFDGSILIPQGTLPMPAMQQSIEIRGAPITLWPIIDAK